MTVSVRGGGERWEMATEQKAVTEMEVWLMGCQKEHEMEIIRSRGVRTWMVHHRRNNRLLAA